MCVWNARVMDQSTSRRYNEFWSIEERGQHGVIATSTVDKHINLARICQSRMGTPMPKRGHCPDQLRIEPDEDQLGDLNWQSREESGADS